MFSGIGGFEYGIQNAYRSSERGKQANTQGNQEQRLFTQEGQDISSENGWPSERPADWFNERPLCIGYSEIDKYAIQIYEKHFKQGTIYETDSGWKTLQGTEWTSLQPEWDKSNFEEWSNKQSETWWNRKLQQPKNIINTHKNYGDATKIIAGELPDFDLLVGGFPCQAFSIAGKRKGFNDTRGTLFFDIARILAEKKPRLVVLENVKGLLSHEGGKTFQTIIGVLTDLGYFVEWQVLNSKNFGVPQNRERVFIIGYLGGQPRRKVFPFREDVSLLNESVESDGRRTQAEYSGTLRASGTVKADQTFIKQLNKPIHSNNRVYGDNGVSPFLNTMQGGNRQPKIAMPVLTPDRPEKRQNGRRFKNDGEPSFILTGQDKHGVSDGFRIRRLTPTECERLQGYPDGWTEGLSDTQRYKCLGNAVTTNVISHLFSGLTG